MRKQSWATYGTYLLAAVAIAAVPLSFAGPGGLRLAVIGPFLLAGPGIALIQMLVPTRSSATNHRVHLSLPLFIALAVGCSLAMSALLATAMLYANLWYPALAVSFLSVVTLALLASTAVRSHTSVDRTPEA